MTGTDDVQYIRVGLADEAVGMCVDKDKSWARSPMPEETLLDIVRGEITSLEDTALEEDHRCARSAVSALYVQGLGAYVPAAM